MKTQEEYLQGLKRWLRDTEDVPLEEMSDFFAKRLDDYEERMSIWEKSYRLVAEAVPDECRKILDKTTPRLIQFHTLKNAVNPPFLGGFLISGTVAA